MWLYQKMSRLFFIAYFVVFMKLILAMMPWMYADYIYVEAYWLM